MGRTCPVCGRPLTMGVMSRVESLASQDVETKSKTNKNGVRWIVDKDEKRPPYVMLVPLLEIISESLKVGVNTKTVAVEYNRLINSLGSEFEILLNVPAKEIERVADPKVAEAIKKVRSGDIVIEPGYDGIFGKVQIWKESQAAAEKETIDQASLF